MLNDLDLNRALQSAQSAADGASQILAGHYGQLRSLTEKFHAGLVSDADRESEAFIRDFLHERHPTYAFLGEETGFTSRPESAAPSEEGVWIVDPLDGTTNFVHQFPLFCVSIGLEIDGQMAVGVIDAPKLGMRFHAVHGKGAFMNGEPIAASQRKHFNEALFATGFSSLDNELEDQYKLLTVAIKKARGIRRAGAAALDLCFVAQGVFDCFWEKNLQPWDTAAGSLIAREAGAIVTDLSGGAWDPRSNSILAATPAIHGEVLTCLANINADRASLTSCQTSVR